MGILGAIGFVALVLYALGGGVYLAITGYRMRRGLRLLGGVGLVIIGGFGMIPVYRMVTCFIWHQCI